MIIMDIFGKPTLDLNNITCNSGGAIGSDTFWENIGEEFGVKTKSFSYKTKYHKSKNKVEISDTDYEEGVIQIKLANKVLNRWGIHRYMNLLARNWAQVKYSSEVFAIGYIIKPGEKNIKGYKNKSKYEIVDGGTGYAVQMAINNNKPVYVFDQNENQWFKWSEILLRFKKIDMVKISYQNFAGIGTREITEKGIKAIKSVYDLTFKDYECGK